MQWFPSIIVGVSLLSSFVSTEPIQYVPFVIFGTYGAWLYLRYLQESPETRLVGDHSAEFACATFFPGPLQYVPDPYQSDLIYIKFYSLVLAAEVCKSEHHQINY